MTGTRRPAAPLATTDPAQGQDRVQRPVVGVVLLTMNDRPEEERASQATLLAQRGVEMRICVVGNGCTPDVVPAGALTVVLPENLGIPGGRNEEPGPSPSSTRPPITCSSWTTTPPSLGRTFSPGSSPRPGSTPKPAMCSRA